MVTVLAAAVSGTAGWLAASTWWRPWQHSESSPESMPALTEIELGVLFEELVRLACRRYSDITYSMVDDSSDASILGWHDGLRIAVNPGRANEHT